MPYQELHAETAVSTNRPSQNDDSAVMPDGRIITGAIVVGAIAAALITIAIFFV